MNLRLHPFRPYRTDRYFTRVTANPAIQQLSPQNLTVAVHPTQAPGEATSPPAVTSPHIIPSSGLDLDDTVAGLSIFTNTPSDEKSNARSVISSPSPSPPR